MHRLSRRKGVPLNRAAPLLAVVLLAACRDERPAVRNDEVARVLARAADASPAPVDPAVLAAAREAQKAATAIASACSVGVAYEEGFRMVTDYCTFKDADRAALRQAATKLHQVSPDAGAGSAYAATVSLFSAFVDVDDGTGGQHRGTVAHYQDVAKAWNALVPADAIPVDLIRFAYPDPEIVGLLDGGPSAGHLVWKRSSDGPCLILPRDKNGKVLPPERAP